MSTIKVLFEDVTKSSSWNIANILTFIGVLITAIISVINLRSNAKWKKKEIDASLTAQARIGWIQSVKEITANSIASIMDLIESEGSPSWKKAYTQLNLLILQFGPNNPEIIKNEICYKNRKVILSDKSKKSLVKIENNDNKNDYIVQYLETVQEFLFYNKDEFVKNKNDLLDKRLEIFKQLLELGIADLEREQNLSYKEDYELVLMTKAYSVTDLEELDEGEKNYDINYQKVEMFEDIENSLEIIYKQLQDECLEVCSMMSQIIRIYLKIEWDRAKTGK